VRLNPISVAVLAYLLKGATEKWDFKKHTPKAATEITWKEFRD